MESPAGGGVVRVLPRGIHSSSSPSFVPSSATPSAPLDGVVTVGFIGSNSSTDPTQLMNRILDSYIFGSGKADKDLVDEESRSEWFKHRRISYHHDSEKGVVFLQFSSCLNPLKALSLSGSDSGVNGSQFDLDECEMDDLKGMLFMFSVCHIIVFLHKGLRIDTQIFKKFRVLQSSKYALSPFIKSQTTPNSNSNANQSSPQLPKTRGSPSRRHASTSPSQFSPLILFALEDHLPDAFVPSKSNNMKRLISSLESEIRFLAKKLHLSFRVSGNSNYAPLFSLDASRAVILLKSSTNQKGEPLNYVSNLITSLGSNLLSKKTNLFTDNEEVQIIRDFIFRHSEILRGRVSGNSIPGSVAAAAIAAATSSGTTKSLTGFDLPGLHTFLELSKSVLNSLISSNIEDDNNNNNNNNEMENVLRNLEKSKGVNTKFSVSWCEKAVPICIKTYSKDLPKYYRTSTHEEQLKKALNIFYSTVKGRAVNEYANKLKKECDLIWENGRQQCDESSLTGRPCVHPKHDFYLGGVSVISQHSSGFYFLHACACGRSRALRDDPFEFETGNECFDVFPQCEKLVPVIEIPGFGTNGTWRLVRIGSAKYYDPQTGILQTGFCTNEKFLFPWKLKNSDNNNNNTNNNNNIDEVIRENNAEQKDMNVNVGKNLITKKPFAEVVAGTGNTGSDKKSLEENGNVLQIGSNIVPVISKNEGTKENNSTQEFIVYVGFEHECPYGHRFLLSEQHLKELDSPVVSHKKGFSAKSAQSSRNNRKSDNDEKIRDGNDDNKDGEFSILTQKLPIFMNCPHCGRSEKNEAQKINFAGTVSQLQRIFIVTPSLPVLLATCPVVQFEDSCLPARVLNREKESRFGFGSRVMLPPDSFLTLRLPFIYGVKTGRESPYPLSPFETRPEKTAWLVDGTALQLVSIGSYEKREG